jgi:CRISPR-associated endoribonuclease Cas6
MEAPFTITADPQLIQLGYECGFGENNSAGFGMVEVVDG